MSFQQKKSRDLEPGDLVVLDHLRDEIIEVTPDMKPGSALLTVRAKRLTHAGQEVLWYAGTESEQTIWVKDELAPAPEIK